MIGKRFVPRDFMRVLQPYLDDGSLELVPGAKHAKIRRKDGITRGVPGSPSDSNALANFKSQVRRFVAGSR